VNLKGIQLTWLGHATFRIQTPEGKTLYVDPWIAGNPKCPESEKNVKKADALICTHGHGDHIGDAVEVGKKLNPSPSASSSSASGSRKKASTESRP
jgi:L-ascorbate metabolism protein UlaG (beta-lactamase superfamily)